MMFTTLLFAPIIEFATPLIENVFVEAVTEIVGEKTFPCENCDKICKSKAGLTRHVNAKHGSKANVSIPSLTNDELTSIVNKVKANLTNEGYWDIEITSDLAKSNFKR